MSNAMRFGKRSLAGVAAGALALGMLTIASAPAASAAPSVKPKASLTGTVSPVRVTLTGTTLDTVPVAQISWTSSAQLASNDTIAVTLSSAPSPSASLGVGPASAIGTATVWTGTAFTTPANNETLAASVTSFEVSTAGAVTAAGVTARIGIAASQPGTYTGTITSNSTNARCVSPTSGSSATGGGVCDVIAFSFTTSGRAASMTLTPASASSAAQGKTPLTVTLLDSAGNVTQPLTVDAVTMSNNAGTTPQLVTVTNDALSGSDPSPPATSLFDGVAVSVFDAPATPGTYSATATPSGTLPSGGVTSQSSTIAVAGTVDPTAATSVTVTTPADADNGGTARAALASVPSGTATVTVTVTTTLTTSPTFRFAAFSSASSGSPATGTINGVAAGTSGLSSAAAFVNVPMSAAGRGTATFTLGGNLLATGSQITIQQVTAANAATSPTVTAVVTQALPAISASASETTPRNNIVQALGTPTPVTVTVVDQFLDPIPNATVRAFRGTSTLLGSAVTNSSGEAQVTVSNASGLAVGGSETYTFSATPFGVATSTPLDQTLTITYTASGAVTAMSVTVTGGATTPILNTATSIATLPYINVPNTGIVTGSATGVYTVATGAGTAGGNFVQFAAAPSPANMVTVTVPDGVKVSLTAPSATTLWSAGSQSVVAASSQAVYVWATKTGTHDIKFTSGAITTTAKIQVATPTTAAYNIAVSPNARTIEAGAFSTVTMTVTDVFGNPVPGITASSNTGVLASATGEVLLSGLTSSNVVATGANGTASITLIAGKPGTGTITFGPSGGTTNVAPAWGAGYTPPVGAPAPVTSAAVAVIVTADADQSISIAGTRGTVSGKSGIIIEGATEGIENGKTVTPFIRFPGETTFTAGSARPAISGDEFTWQRKTGKRVTVYVELSDDASVRSNRVTIQAS